MANRQHLYRGKYKDNGEWVYGDRITEPYGVVIQYYKDNKRIKAAVIPETIGEWTGLCDKNGVKISEDDIVEYNDGFYYFKGKVVFECGAFGIACEDVIPLDLEYACNNDNFISLWELIWNSESLDSEYVGVEVIGNIHDNPELLEV